jgi:hypothetical protein
LDSAYDAWEYMRMVQGFDDFTNMDTTTDALQALNMAMRTVAVDIGFSVRDTFAITDGIYEYVLHHRFRPSLMEGDEVEEYFHVYYHSATRDRYYGVEHGSPEQVVEGSGSGVTYWRWNLEDSTLHITPAPPDFDSLIVVGLGRVSPVTHGGSSLSPIPEDIRPAVCWCAVAVLSGDARPMMYEIAMREFERYKPKMKGLLQEMQP